MKRLLFYGLVLMTTTGFGQSIEELILTEYKPKQEFAEGHPFLFEEYTSADLKVASGTAEKVMVRFNLADNNLLVSDEGKEFILKKDLIESFTLREKNGTVHTFIPLNIQGRNLFVEQLFSGESGVKYVKWHRKQFMKGKPEAGFANGVPSADRFEQKEMYLLVVNNQSVEYSEKKSELVEILSQGDASMKAFVESTMKEKKLKANKEEGVIALLQAREEYLKSKS